MQKDTKNDKSPQTANKKTKYRTAKWLEENYGVKAQTTYSWVRSHDLPIYRIGKSVLIREDDFIQFVEQHREGRRNT